LTETTLRHIFRLAVVLMLLTAVLRGDARADDQIFFPAYQNVTSMLVQRINAETVRIDMSAWYLTEHAISIALANKFRAGVPVRLIGDRVAIFEADPLTKREFYWLAAQGIPIRLRYNPTWFPEIAHWKATIFAGQRMVSFGSANYTPFELAPASATNYKDEVVLLSDDSSIVDAFKTKFDRFWNDTTPEPMSRIVNPPFFKDWYDACALEPGCADFTTEHPSPTPMVVNTGRLEPDYAMPPDMGWSQGPEFNNRLIQEINREVTAIDLVAYRLTVSRVTDALIGRHLEGVATRVMIDPEQYSSQVWPEYWLTRANVDRLWAAGIQIRQRVHVGLTHMKLLITSNYSTVASSNIASGWQRDHNYFVPAATKPAIHAALRTRFDQMWNDPSAFGPFRPLPPAAASLTSPPAGTTGVAAGTALVWARAPFATSYDVYLGTSSGSMTRVANVPAVLTETPPTNYSWTPSTPLQAGAQYYWRIISRTFATDVDATIVAASPIWSFTAAGSAGGSLPTPWVTQDVGATGLAGAASYAAGVFSVSGAGSNIWGSADSFRFVYQSLPGDGEIVARVASVPNTDTFAKAGIMIRQSLAAGASHLLLDVRPNGAGIELLTRSSAGGATSYLGGAAMGAPVWLRLTRTGTTIAAAVSNSGSTWTSVGSATLPTGPMYIGLVVNSHDTTRLNTSTFDGVTVSGSVTPPPPPPPSLPSPWSNGDVGATGLAGSASFSTGVFTVQGAGSNIWGTSDGFHYVYQTLTGDGQIVARVTGLQNTSPYAKAGVMIRRSTSAGSAHVVLDARPNGAGLELMTRASNGGETSYLGGATAGTPIWLRLTRAGASVTGATSTNGSTWTTIGTATLPSGNVLVGLVVSSQDTTRLNTATFDSVEVSSSTPPEPLGTDVVIHAHRIPASALHGAWSAAPDPTSPASIKLVTTNTGFAATNSPAPGPVHYVDVSFDADAGVPYTLWLRLQAQGNSKLNDAVWVQFSDALFNGAPIYPINSSSGLLVNLATDSGASSLNGWGWTNSAYWLAQPTTFTFGGSGTHTLRIQVREDGVAFDQIVLSRGTYLSSPPGGPTNDSTIVSEP
jgi:regulation of enolase protein 1 (concanavalin A-like superfamily)